MRGKGNRGVAGCWLGRRSDAWKPRGVREAAASQAGRLRGARHGHTGEGLFASILPSHTSLKSATAIPNRKLLNLECKKLHPFFLSQPVDAWVSHGNNRAKCVVRDGRGAQRPYDAGGGEKPSANLSGSSKKKKMAR